MLKFLIAQGADVQQFLNSASSPLHMAVRGPKTTAFLLDLGAPVGRHGLADKTELHLAAQTCTTDTRTIQLLIAHGSPVDARDSMYQTPLMDAAGHGSVVACEALVAAGAQIDARDKYGETALLQAIGGGRNDVVQWLIRHGAGVNARYRNPYLQPPQIGGNALTMARERCTTETIKLLLEFGAKEPAALAHDSDTSRSMTAP